MKIIVSYFSSVIMTNASSDCFDHKDVQSVEFGFEEL